MDKAVRFMVISLCVLIIIFIRYQCQNQVSTKCLEGHTYYVHYGLYDNSYTPKFDDDGKPTKCKEGEQ